MPRGIFPRTKEFREKLSNILRGRKITWKDKISLGNKGKKRTDEMKKKYSLAKKGKPSGNKGGYKLSEETRRRMAIAKSGEKCIFWKGGISKINDTIRGTLEYRLWREAVFKRDNHTCIWCGARSKKGEAVILNADHIKPFSQYPELRFALDNGRTLCVPCHKTTDTFKGKSKNYKS